MELFMEHYALHRFSFTCHLVLFGCSIEWSDQFWSESRHFNITVTKQH